MLQTVGVYTVTDSILCSHRDRQHIVQADFSRRCGRARVLRLAKVRRGLGRGALGLALGLVLVSGLLGCGREPTSEDTLVATSEVDADEPTSTDVSSSNDLAVTTPDTPAPIDTTEPTNIETEALATTTAAPLQAAVPINRENLVLVQQLTRIGKGRISDSDLSPDGRLLAVATMIGAYLYDVATMKEDLYRETNGAIISIEFSPDGQSFATGSNDGTLQLWNTANGELLFTQRHHAAGIVQLAFSPDGQMLASGSEYEPLRVWNTTDGSVVAVLEEFSAVRDDAVAFSPDGRTLAYSAVTYSSESDNPNRTIELWDLVEHMPLASLELTDSYPILAFSPDGQRLVTGSTKLEGGTLQIWRVADGSLLTTLDGHTDAARDVLFSSDGQLLISAAKDGTVRLWDGTDGTPLVTLDHPNIPYEIFSTDINEVNSVAVSPDGTMLATGTLDRAIRLWNADDGTLLATLPGHLDTPYKLEFLPDGQTLVSTAYDSTVRIWDVTGNALLATLDAHADSIMSLAYSPDGRILAAALSNGTVRLINPEDNAVVAVLEVGVEPISSLDFKLAFTPDGTMLVAAANDVRVWRVGDWELISPFEMYAGGGGALAISPDGRTVASEPLDQDLQLWDLATGATLATIEDVSMATTAAFSPDGRVLATGQAYSEVIGLWDATNGAALAPLDGSDTGGHTDTVNSVVFSPDGETLASGGFDNTIKLWDMPGDTSPITLEGHADRVQSVNFSSDGQLLVSGSRDSTVRLWHASYTSIPPTVLEGHTVSVNSVVFSPDGRTIASGSSDGTIRLWGIPAD